MSDPRSWTCQCCGHEVGAFVLAFSQRCERCGADKWDAPDEVWFVLELAVRPARPRAGRRGGRSVSAERLKTICERAETVRDFCERAEPPDESRETWYERFGVRAFGPVYALVIQDIPWLVAEVEALKSELKEIKDEIRRADRLTRNEE